MRLKNKTKKNRKMRHTTRRIKGGKKLSCLTDTPFNKFVNYLWSQVQYTLREYFYNNYRFDQHQHGRFASCNLWGWVPSHTSKTSDTHFDVYFINRDSIGMALTYNNMKNYRRAVLNIRNYDIEFDDPEYYKNTWDSEFNIFVNDISDWIDYNYWRWIWELDSVRKD
jgi:hypothetical protein